MHAKSIVHYVFVVRHSPAHEALFDHCKAMMLLAAREAGEQQLQDLNQLHMQLVQDQALYCALHCLHQALALGMRELDHELSAQAAGGFKQGN